MDNNTRQSVLETYGKAWSETDEARQLKLYEQCLSPDCIYTDPNSVITGYVEFSAYMAEFQKSNPGGGFAQTALMSHHDSSLMHWNMLDGAGNVVSKGTSYFRFATDGRLLQMTGFFEAPSAS